MDFQIGFNIAVGLAAFFGALWIRAQDKRHDETKKSLESQLKELQDMRLLVTGKYITREEHEAMMKRIVEEIRSVGEKVDEFNKNAVAEIHKINLRCAHEHGTRG